MKFHYDQKIDALSLRFNNEKSYRESEEVSEGVIVDYDAKGKMIGIEVLQVSQRFPREFGAQIQKKQKLSLATR